MRQEKGSLTIEATIALPVFILVLLFIINFLNIFYLQLVIQQGLNNVGNTLSEYCYAIDLVEGIENFSLSEETKGKENDLKDAVEGMVSSGTTALSILNGNLNLDTLPTLVESGKKLYESVKKAESTVKSVGVSDVKSYLFSTAVDVGGGSIVSVMMDDYMNQVKVNRNMIDGEIQYRVFIDAANQYDLVFVATYQYHDSLMDMFQKKVSLRQVVRVHPWVGGKTEGIRQSIFK